LSSEFHFIQFDYSTAGPHPICGLFLLSSEFVEIVSPDYFTLQLTFTLIRLWSVFEVIVLTLVLTFVLYVGQ
jgi:hypothetical protein